MDGAWGYQNDPGAEDNSSEAKDFVNAVVEIVANSHSQENCDSPCQVLKPFSEFRIGHLAKNY